MSLYDLLSKTEKERSGQDDSVKIARIYNHYLSAKSNEIRQPKSIQLELLPICNFSCSFCYIRKSYDDLEAKGQHILRFDEWKYIIDEALKLGIDGISFSGGECTLHPDFIKIYKYAYENDLQISLITNGSCITDEIINMFVQYPPSNIRITIYGISADTYERTCGNGAAFEKVMSNIARLTEKGFTVILNYTAGKDNFCDMEAILAFAREKRLSIVPTDALINCGNCNDEILDEELVDYKEFSRITHKHLCAVTKQDYYEYEKSYYTSFVVPKKSDNEKGLLCSAGKSLIFINWQGLMTPCVGFEEVSFDPFNNSFLECWKQVMKWTDTVPALKECEECIFQLKCPRCFALHYGDMGEFGKVSPRFCFKKLYPEEAAASLAKYEEMKANGEIE